MKTSIKLITITMLLSVVALKADTDTARRQKVKSKTSTQKANNDFNPPKTFGLGFEHLGKSVAEIGTLGAFNAEKNADGTQKTGNAFGDGFKNLGQGVVEVGTLGLGNVESQ